MYHIKATVQGLAPVCFNQPLEEDMADSPGGRPSAEERAEKVERRVYKNGHGVYMPRRWFKKCLLEGCTLAQLKVKGNKSLYPYLDGNVIILEEEILTGKDNYDFIHERPGRIPPKTGGMVKIRTPALREGWEVSFTLLVADDALGSDDIKTALSTGGLTRGVGNARPEFGRFQIANWQKIKGMP